MGHVLYGDGTEAKVGDLVYVWNGQTRIVVELEGKHWELWELNGHDYLIMTTDDSLFSGSCTLIQRASAST